MSADNQRWKEQTKKQWNKTPCAGPVKESDNYYLAVEKNRYEEYAPWMPSFFQYSQFNDKKILEIGYGVGTDLCQFAKAGAECFGVDITEKHHELANENFRSRGLNAQLFLEDANKLHFDDEMFDVVYSFGVLHHTPDTIRCISEAYRVLKPGGLLMIALYNKYSAFHLFSVLLYGGIRRGGLKKLGYKGLLSTIEKGADGINIKPLVKLYSQRQLKTILGDFKEISIHVKHLDRSHFGGIGNYIPQFMINLLEPYMGWYVIAKARK